MTAALKEFDFAFAENGLIAYRMGVQLESQSFIKYLGEANYKKLVNFILIKIAEIEDIPVKRCVVDYS
jgi:phosphomannomutase